MHRSSPARFCSWMAERPSVPRSCSNIAGEVPVNIASHIDRASRHFPTQPAVIFEGHSMTFAELRDQVQRVAAGLAAAGVQPGDRVALFLPNAPAFVVAYQACQWLGAVTVSVNVMLTTDELRYLLEDSGARFVFTTEALWPV